MKSMSTKVVLFLVCSLFYSMARASTLEVRRFLEENYLNAAYNELKISRLKKAFHPSFQMVWTKEKELKSLKLQNWISIINKKKKEGGNREMNVLFKKIDVNESNKTAFARLDLMKNGKIQYYDYLFLKKINSEWKIVHKFFELSNQQGE